MFTLPRPDECERVRIFGERVSDTVHARRLSTLARIIVRDMNAEFRSSVSTPERFGVNAWIYGERVIDVEIAGFLDVELDDPAFLNVTRQEFCDFVDRYNWTNPSDERDQRFQGAVFFCNEEEQRIRRHCGRVRTYRSWRRFLSRRHRPFLPLARGWL